MTMSSTDLTRTVSVTDSYSSVAAWLPVIDKITSTVTVLVLKCNG
jgi:hypothetical protein